MKANECEVPQALKERFTKLNIDPDSLTEEQISRYEKHMAICDLLNEVHIQKDIDYGSAFNESIDDYGPVAGLIRMSDKWKRINSLIKSSSREALVKDESIEDTLIDLANYSIMFALDIKARKERNL